MLDTLLLIRLLYSFVVFLADNVHKSDFKKRLTMMSGRSCHRKVQGVVPHDIGDPGKTKKIVLYE